MEYSSVIKKEQAPDTSNNIDKSQKHYAKWNKQVTEGYILHNSFI